MGEGEGEYARSNGAEVNGAFNNNNNAGNNNQQPISQLNQGPWIRGRG